MRQMCVGMELHSIPAPACKHHPGAVPVPPWNLPGTSSASPLHCPGIPVTAHGCIILLAAGNVLRAERVAAALGSCEFLLLMSSFVSSLPCLTPAPALLLCGNGDTQQKRHCIDLFGRFVMRGV